MDKRDKDVLRQEIRQKRNDLSGDARRSAGRAIHEKLHALPEYARAWTLMSYVSFGGEVGTLDLIRKSLAMARTVCVPRTKWKAGRIEAVQIFDPEEIDYSGFVPQPVDGKVVPPGEIEMVIVPGIVFDASGNRIGTGRGFYDRFLPLCRGVRVGLAFDLQVMPEEIPHEVTDARLDIIITETRVLRFRT